MRAGLMWTGSTLIMDSRGLLGDWRDAMADRPM